MIERSLSLMNKTKDLWCRAVHNQPMWPVNGRYQCRCCLRYHHVRWTEPAVCEKRNALNTR